MTEQEAMTKPIPEVVEAFNTVYERNDTWGIRRDKEIATERDMLRRVLLERCKREYSMCITYLWGRYGINVGKTMPTFLHPGEAESWAASLSFMAWELDQCNKDQEGGEG